MRSFSNKIPFRVLSVVLIYHFVLPVSLWKYWTLSYKYAQGRGRNVSFIVMKLFGIELNILLWWFIWHSSRQIFHFNVLHFLLSTNYFSLIAICSLFNKYEDYDFARTGSTAKEKVCELMCQFLKQLARLLACLAKIWIKYIDFSIWVHNLRIGFKHHPFLEYYV